MFCIIYLPDPSVKALEGREKRSFCFLIKKPSLQPNEDSDKANWSLV